MPHGSLVGLLTFASLLLVMPRPSAQCDLERQELTPPDGQPGDGFGYRVERSQDVLVVTSAFDDDQGTDSGSVYVYVRAPGAPWVLARKLLASDGAAGDAFGYAVAIAGSEVFVGAPGHDLPSSECGAVYVFARDQGGPGQWGEVAHFVAPSAGVGASFGQSLAARGDRLLVGAPHHGRGVPGRATLYRRDAGAPQGWTTELDFTGEDPATALEFGHDVALDEHTLAVSGSRTSVVPYSDSYVVHLRERDAGGSGSWGEVRRISSPSGTRDFFGYEISLDGDHLACVSPAETNLQTSEIGALYLYGRDQGGTGQWGLEQRIVAPSAGGFFAADEVDLRGDWLVAGNFGFPAQGLSSAGAVFLFGRNVGGPDRWGEVVRVENSEPAAQAFFGLDLTLEGDELLVGAPGVYAGSVVGEVYALDLRRVARASWRNDGAGRNPAVHAALTRPELGTTYAATVDLAASGHGQALLVAFAERSELALPGGQVRLGARPVGFAVGSGPLAHFAFALPADAALCGVELATQAVLLGGGRTFALSNAQDLVLGFH